MEEKTLAPEVENLKAYVKLSEVQNEIHLPKNEFNEFGNFSYRTAEGILEAVKPVLYKNKAIIVLNDEIITVNGFNYVRSTARFVDLESGASITSSSEARECDHPKMTADQCTGTASSYARKFSLSALLAIGSSKDADEGNTKQPNKTPTGNWGSKNANNTQSAPAANQNAPAAKQGWGNKNQPAASASGNGWGKSATNSQPAPTAQQGWSGNGKSQSNANTQQRQGWSGNGKTASAPAKANTGNYYDDIPLPEEPPRYANRQSA